MGETEDYAAKITELDILLSELRDAITGTPPDNKTLNDILTELKLKADLTETQPVSAAALPLPAGAAKETRQVDANIFLFNLTKLTEALTSVGTDEILVRGKNADSLVALSGIVEERITNTSLAAGTNLLNGSVVPAGKIWKVTQAFFQYTGTPPTLVLLFASGLAITMALLQQNTPTSGQYYPWSGEVWLQAGDRVSTVVYRATLNDDLTFAYCGTEMTAP